MDGYREKLFNAVDLHYKYKKYPEAKALYKELINLYPEKPDSFYHLGLLEAEQGNLKEAKGYMHQVIDIYPSSDTYKYLGKLYLIEKDLPKALKYFKNTLIYDSRDAETRGLLNKIFPQESNFIKDHNLDLKNNYISAKDYPKCKYQEMYPPHTIERVVPKFVENLLTEKQKELLDKAIETYKTSHCTEGFVLEIPNGRAWADQGEQTYIITEEGQCISDIFEQEAKAIVLDNPPPEINVGDNLLVLSSSFGGNFYHWLTWTIPRIYMLEKAGYRLEDFDKILINYIGFKFQKDFLKMLGIPLEKIIGTMPKGGMFRAKKLVTASLPNYLQTPLFVTDSIRERFLKQEHYSEERPRIIYLSRNKSKSRKIINEYELIRYLDNMGFTTVYPEQENFDEQIAIFANADIVLAPHGAGLTNLCFSNPHTKVIEIFNEELRSKVDTGFFRICSNMQHDHYIMFGEPVKGESLDMKVDLDKLGQTIELLLKDCQTAV